MRQVFGVLSALTGLILLYWSVAVGRTFSALLEEEGTESFSAGYGPFGMLGCMAFVFFVALIALAFISYGVRNLRDNQR